MSEEKNVTLFVWKHNHLVVVIILIIVNEFFRRGRNSQKPVCGFIT